MGPVQMLYAIFITIIVDNLYSEWLTKEAVDGLGDLNIGGQIIQTVKYADDLALMSKEETVAHNSQTYRLIPIAIYSSKTSLLMMD